MYNSNQIAKNIELFLDSKDSIALIINYCVFLYFKGCPKEILAEAIKTLIVYYKEYEDSLEDCYDLLMGNGTAWFKFPFNCIASLEDMSYNQH